MKALGMTILWNMHRNSLKAIKSVLQKTRMLILMELLASGDWPALLLTLCGKATK